MPGKLLCYGWGNTCTRSPAAVRGGLSNPDDEDVVLLTGNEQTVINRLVTLQSSCLPTQLRFVCVIESDGAFESASWMLSITGALIVGWAALYRQRDLAAKD